ALSRRLFTITSIVYYSWAKKQSSFLSLILNIYLIGSSIKRRVLKTLLGLGIYYSYY
ncbi:hypothetical protein V2W45_1252426, partial [Cenococcum geophilum]